MFVLAGDELRAAFQHGTKGERTPGRISIASPLFQAIVRRREPLSVLTPAGEQLLDGHGLAAVPVIIGGHVTGALLLEACSPEQLDPVTTDRLAALAMAMAAAHPFVGGMEQNFSKVSLAAPETAPAEATRFPSWRRVRRRFRHLSVVSSLSGRRG
jgi:hypothetical protein